MTVKLFLDATPGAVQTLRVRALYVDGALKEFTTGEAHDITDEQFSVQRAYRVNDALPGDGHDVPKWRWQRGNWLLVDRNSGRISVVRLPDFEPFYSAGAWYRDYVAYCGLGDNGEKLYAIVAQVGIHKPLLRNFLLRVTGTEAQSPCGHPVWQREPMRVTFSLADGQKTTFNVHGHAASALETPSEESESK